MHGVGLPLDPWYALSRVCYHSFILILCCTATSVDVERTFSRGRRLLTHVRSRLSAQSTRAVLCLGDWGKGDRGEAKVMRAVAKLDEVVGDGDDYMMDDGWDRLSTVLKGRAVHK